tara:strand:- start:939 stop:1199 length:261 start_codon:yes stop_codon:yes gene_type:complete
MSKEYDEVLGVYMLTVAERDLERIRADRYERELREFRALYDKVISRINKLEDDTKAALEFADLPEDDKGTELILSFCDDITELVGE